MASSNSIISDNFINISGTGYGIQANGDYIQILNNYIFKTSNYGIYQYGKLTGLLVKGNIINSGSSTGIMVVKASRSKYPTNVTVISNIVA